MEDLTPVASEMTKRAVCIEPGRDAYEALAVMRRMGVRHLPVTQQGELVGMLSDRDLFRRGELRDGELVVGRQTVGEIMTSRVKTCKATDTLADVALTMTTQRLDALPVVDADSGRVLGIITSTDLLRHLIRPGAPVDVNALLAHKLQRYDFSEYCLQEG